MPPPGRPARTAVLATLLSVLLVVLGAAPSVAATPMAERAARQSPEITRVVVISVDGLNPDAITRLGATGTPTFHRLMREGAWTFNARTEVEQTVTLSNHTGMLTSRRVNRARGGHGVTWDDDRLVPRTVQVAAGHAVASVFTRLERLGLSTAMFASKTKFSLYQRSWPRMDRAEIRLDDSTLAGLVREDLDTTSRAFTFAHFSAPDVAGHTQGWLSPAYLASVRSTDTLIGGILSAVAGTDTVVVVTSDHGGMGTGHGVATALADYRIPFLVWGPGVPAGAGLYAINPTYADPGTRRPGYAAARQPIRNGDVGNLVLDMLGYGPIPGSGLDAGQDLEVFATP